MHAGRDLARGGDCKVCVGSKAAALQLVFLVAITAALLPHGFAKVPVNQPQPLIAEPKISTVNLLLPYPTDDVGQVWYELSAQGGCYAWSVEDPALLEIRHPALESPGYGGKEDVLAESKANMVSFLSC